MDPYTNLILFFRQMRELIEEGYIYCTATFIKLAREKRQYVKDDEELLGYLTQKALKMPVFTLIVALQRLTVTLEQLVKEAEKLKT